MITSGKKRYFVSRPACTYAWNGGYYSRVFQTRRSDVFIFATNSPLKIEWLIYLGVTLDIPTENFRDFKYAVSVRRLVDVEESPNFYRLYKELSKLRNIRLEASREVFRVFGVRHFALTPEEEKVASNYIYARRKQVPITAPAIEYAMKKFGECNLLDEKEANYLADPVTGHIFPYDALNFDWLTERKYYPPSSS